MNDSFGACYFGKPLPPRIKFTRDNPTSWVKGFMTIGENTKLGIIPNFSLTRGVTCPGATTWCNTYCYGTLGRYILPSVSKKYNENYQRSLLPGFVNDIIYEIKFWQRMGYPKIFRIHCMGDFYSNEYVEKWIDIIRALPETRFFAFTRSWLENDSVDYATLMHLKRQPNMVLYASIDPDTGIPLAGWLEAGINGTYNPNSMHCLHDVNKTPCIACGYCIKGDGNVWFEHRFMYGRRVPTRTGR